MNVKELIEALRKYPQDATVLHCINGNGIAGIKLTSFVSEMTGEITAVFINADKLE